jgi:hypothetical protein
MTAYLEDLVAVHLKTGTGPMQQRKLTLLDQARTAFPTMPMDDALHRFLLGLYPPATNYSAAVMADSPIGYWRFEEAGGLVSADVSATANHATYTANVAGFTPRTGGLTGSLAISGDGVANRRVIVPAHAAYAVMATDGDFSIEWWAKFTPGVPGAVVIDLRGGVMAQLATISLNADAFQVMRQNNAGAGQGLNYPVAGTGVWHQYVFVKTGLRFDGYQDGLAASFYPSSPTGPYDPPDKIGFLGNAAVVANLYTGALDDVSFYGTALSAARISVHYAARL